MEQCKEHFKLIETLEKNAESLSQTATNLLLLTKDFSHIKNRIDNGLSKTIFEIHKTMTELRPIIEENKVWVDKYKQGNWWITVVAVGGGCVTILFSIFYVIFKFIVK